MWSGLSRSIWRCEPGPQIACSYQGPLLQHLSREMVEEDSPGHQVQGDDSMHEHKPLHSQGARFQEGDHKSAFLKKF